MFIESGRQTVNNTESKNKSLKESRSRRTLRSVYHVHVPKQHNESSFMQDLPDVRQNAKETNDKILNNMNAEEKNVFSTVENEDLVNEKYRNCNLEDCKLKIYTNLDDLEAKDKQHEDGNKTIGCVDDDEKRLMDLRISEIEGTKRLESLIERRRSRTPTKFQTLRHAMRVGVKNNNRDQISSVNIPKRNPFLSKNTDDLNPPGSAPTYMIKNNPFDLPYDPHEEKPILTDDSFKDEFIATHQKEPFDTESMDDKHERYFDTDFAIKQLRGLGASKVATKKDDNKQPQERHLIPDAITNDHHAIEGDSSMVNVVDHTKQHEVDHSKEHDVDQTKEHEVDHTKELKVDCSVDHTKELEVNHDAVSSDQSTSSCTSSEDEPILKPNKEAILHCLSMSRMRVLSQKNSFHRNVESFDCGPSTLFDKSKTDYFIFGPTKQIHNGSTNSLASDMQVEVSELGSPGSTNISSIDEEGRGSLVNSTNPSETDLNEVRLRDVNEVCEQGTFEPGIAKPALDSDRFESNMKPEEIDEDR